MKRILVLGSGLSTSSLIDYLLVHAEKEDWLVTVGDIDPSAALLKVNGHPRGKAVSFASPRRAPGFNVPLGVPH